MCEYSFWITSHQLPEHTKPISSTGILYTYIINRKQTFSQSVEYSFPNGLRGGGDWKLYFIKLTLQVNRIKNIFMKISFPQTLLWKKGKIFGKCNGFARLLIINLICQHTSQNSFFMGQYNKPTAYSFACAVARLWWNRTCQIRAARLTGSPLPCHLLMTVT